MRRPTRQELSAWLLIAALFFNAIIHFRSPAYRYYKEQCEELRSLYDEFQDRVKDEFVPAIKDLATNMVDSVSLPRQAGAPGLPARGSVEFVSDYRYQRASCSYYGIEGCFIDGWFYRLGDRYLGSPILAVEPSCAFTRDFVIRPSARQRPSDKTDINPISSTPKKDLQDGSTHS